LLSRQEETISLTGVLGFVNACQVFGKVIEALVEDSCCCMSFPFEVLPKLICSCRDSMSSSCSWIGNCGCKGFAGRGSADHLFSLMVTFASMPLIFCTFI